MTVEELISKWGFDINFEPLEKLDEKFKEVQESVLHVGEAAIAAAATIFGFAKLTADAGEKALLASQQIGISIEAYQELAYAGKLVGLSTEEMQMGFMHLSRSMQEAATRGSSKGGPGEAFARLGIQVRDANGHLMGSDAVMMQIADRFKTMPNGPAKTATAMELFGRSGARLIPILNKGSKGVGELRQEAHDLGVVLDEETAEKSEEFNQAIERSEAALIGVRNVVGAALIPGLTKLAERFGNFVKENRKLIALKITQLFDGLTKFLKITWSLAESLYTSMVGIVNVFGGFERVAIAAGIAMGLFAAASVLASIGEMAMGVMALVEAITLANASALLIPILIGAAVIAVGLVIEDIVAYFQGRDSVTYVLIEKFKEFFGYLEEKFDSMGTWAKVGIAVLLAPFRLLIAALSEINDLFSILTGRMSLLTAGKNLVDRLGQVMGWGTQGSLKGALGDRNAPGSSITDSISSQLGITGASAPAIAPGAGSNSAQTNHVSAPMTINVGDNASPMDVGRAAKQGAQDGWDAALRGTYNAFGGSGGH